MTKTHYSTFTVATVRNLLLALVFCAIALCAYAPVAFADTDSQASSSHRAGKSIENRSQQGTQQKILQVQKKIAQLKKQLALHELLLARLTAATGSSTASTTAKGTVLSLTTTDTTPTLRGTASGVTGVSIGILSGTSTEVYDSGIISVTKGKWSHTISPALVVGSYGITLEASGGSALATGSLVIQNASSTVLGASTVSLDEALKQIKILLMSMAAGL